MIAASEAEASARLAELQTLHESQLVEIAQLRSAIAAKEARLAQLRHTESAALARAKEAASIDDEPVLLLPRASSSFELDKPLWLRTEPPATLADSGKHIQTSLYRCGETDLRWAGLSRGQALGESHGASDGFAVATALRRTDEAGKPITASPNDPHPCGDSNILVCLARGLFTADPGHYRLLLFVVTSADVRPEGTHGGMPKVWEHSRINLLSSAWSVVMPKRMDEAPVTDGTSCVVLAYAFEQSHFRTAPTLVEARSPQPFTASEFLEAAGILDEMRRRE